MSRLVLAIIAWVGMSAFFVCFLKLIRWFGGSQINEHDGNISVRLSSGHVVWINCRNGLKKIDEIHDRIFISAKPAPRMLWRGVVVDENQYKNRLGIE